MTAHESTDEHGRKGGAGRRTFLAGIGATGLAAAATIFGRATPASALVNAGCCTLCYSPSSSHTMAQCESGTYYRWSCNYSGGVYCDCCEHGTLGDNCIGVTYSKYSCQY
jgi:hypothetical protein